MTSTPEVQTTTTYAVDATEASTSTTSTLDPDDVEVSNEILDYLTSVEELLADTAYVESVLEDPEIFVATGILFCEQLAEGESPADLLAEYVELLTGSDIGQAVDDDLTLAGSILGNAVGHLCPEYTEMIEDGL